MVSLETHLAQKADEKAFRFPLDCCIIPSSIRFYVSKHGPTRSGR